MTKKEIADLKKASKAVSDMDKDIQTNAALFVGQSLTENVTEVKNPKTGRKQKIAPTPWYKLFIKGVMEDALTDPNGRCGQMLASTLFTQDILDRLGAQAQKTKKDQIDFAIYQIRQTLYKEQQEVFDNDIDQKIIVICSRRAGKCFSPDTLLRKFDGSVVRADEVAVGDVLIDDESRPTIVEALACGEEEMFEVESNKPSIKFKCNASHILTVIRTRKSTNRTDYHGYDEVGKVYDIPLKEFLSMSSHAQSSFALFRARAEYPTREHYIDPYLLGAWLGDGNRTQPSLTVDVRETEEINELFRIAQVSGWKEPSIYPSKSKAVTVFMRSPRRHSIMSEIKRLGIYRNKHIPEEYMIDSSYNRLRLLAGLIDTDGSYTKKGNLEFYNCNKTLVDNVVELSHSLGFHVTVSSKISMSGNVAYTVCLKGKLSQIPTVIPRKRAKDCKQNPYYGFKVRSLGKGKYNGFTLSGNGRCLLSDYTVVHNTELNARKLMKACLTPETPCLYLNKTFANAINQLFDLVIEVAGKLELPIKRSSKSDGDIEFTNGSTIKFGGVNDIAAIDKYRGYKYKMVIVDEVGHIKNGQYLIDEVLTPATADFAGSQMMFTGTPPRVKNYATRLWNSKIRKYHWTAEVNPFIPDFRAFINRVCEEKGLTIDDPFIQREYFGNMNAYDSDAIVFKGWKTYHDLPKLLNGEVVIDGRAFHPTWVYIGVDWGGTDNNAIVSVAVDLVDKRALVYDVWADRMVGTEVIKATIHNKYIMAQELLKRYGIEENRIRVITDTNQVEFCVDLHKEGLPVEKAVKYDMMNSVEEMSAELRTGRCLVPDTWKEEDNYLVKDLNSTVYVRDEETDALKSEIDDAAYHPDAAHALRYALRNWVALPSWGKGASNTELLDPTVMPGTENLKQYGTMNIQNGATEEFII